MKRISSCGAISTISAIINELRVLDQTHVASTLPVRCLSRVSPNGGRLTLTLNFGNTDKENARSPDIVKNSFICMVVIW